MDLGLKGQTAVVTGASKGIGLAIARGLAAEGCAVQIVARNRPAIESAAQSIRTQYAVEVKSHALDLALSDSVTALLEATGTPDILVNNAGAIPVTSPVRPATRRSMHSPARSAVTASRTASACWRSAPAPWKPSAW